MRNLPLTWGLMRKPTHLPFTASSFNGGRVGRISHCLCAVYRSLWQGCEVCNELVELGPVACSQKTRCVRTAGTGISG